MRYRTIDDVVRVVANRLVELADNPIQLGTIATDLGVVAGVRYVLVDTAEGRRRASYGLVQPVQVGGRVFVGCADGRVTAPWIVWWSNYQVT